MLKSIPLIAYLISTNFCPCWERFSRALDSSMTMSLVFPVAAIFVRSEETTLIVSLSA
ncbi:hypothetical protein [Mycoplasmopsis pulmonis]|uniref:hypothetical protein n=1 Tax=Mycoplasmopsis pulmonis TaxID=2107 RepID=UPI0013052596|nr:hypothetical protein [Mycoplasmopsis pulmonis]